MTTRYPSLAHRRQVAKRRDAQLKADVEAAKHSTEPAPPVITYAEGLLPDIPGKVHGIVSLDPPGVQCDGCGYVHTHITLALAVQTGPRFCRYATDPRPEWRDGRRLCGDCAAREWDIGET